MEAPLLEARSGEVNLIGDDGDYVAVKGWKSRWRIMRIESAKMWRIGGPIAFQIVCQYGIGSVTTVFVGHLGDIELSAFSIALSVIATFAFGFLILPAIKAEWPAHLSKTIWIQQDNARPHITDQDPAFKAAASADGFNIHLMQQPPNSPDMNANDLGFFVSIQSLQNQYACINADDLVDAVQKSFEELQPITLNKVFISLQQQFVEIMKVNGQNRYKQPHIGKDALIRAGTLPQNLEVTLDVVTASIHHLIQEGDVE